MKQVRGIWLPDSDTHFPRMMDRAQLVFRGGVLTGTYQKNKLDRALALTKRRRTAVDIGAHVGYWSMWLADVFSRVVAFEPVEDHRACFERNARQENVTLYRCALGAQCGAVSMETDEENTGKAHIGGGGDVPMAMLDDFNLEKVDFIKIDTEGSEAQVIEGARDTITRCRPVIIVEQSGHHKRYRNSKLAAVEMLSDMGMRQRETIGDDHIMTWRKRGIA